jgi:P-type E1-E2 ATPase
VLAVVVLNALIGFAQEYRAGQAIAALADLVAEPARVRRDGAWVEIPAENVVPGDLLEVAQGDRVAADVRLLDATALRAQESALTGESEPVDKGIEPVADDAPLADRRSLLFAGTVVSAGSGRGITVATGSDTELGRISTLLGQVEPLETPLTRDLAHFGRVITAAIGVAAVALAIVAALRGFPFADAALAGIGVQMVTGDHPADGAGDRRRDRDRRRGRPRAGGARGQAAPRPGVAGARRGCARPSKTAGGCTTTSSRHSRSYCRRASAKR